MVVAFTSATVLLHLTIGIQTAVIVLLVLLLLRVGAVGAQSRRQLVQARRERNQAKEQLATLRRMSEIRLDVVARLGGFGRDTE
jgi:MFS superfamily sulfate permease-like transporter